MDVLLTCSVPAGYSSSAAAAVDAVCRALPAVQLWHRAELSTLDSIEDGFVAVTRDCTLQTLDQMRESRAGTSEVLLVDATIDTAFAADVEKVWDAREMALCLADSPSFPSLCAPLCFPSSVRGAVVAFPFVVLLLGTVCT